MATNTANLALIKPAGTDKVRIAQINQNMDILDEKIGPVGNTSVQNQIIANDSGMAILSTGNTHSAIASGQYVYIRSHSTLAEGLYKANSAISANATLSTSNVTRVSSGGMNDLKGQIDLLNSQVGNGVPTETLNSDLNAELTPGWYLIGNSATNTPPNLSSGKLHIEYGGTTNYVRQTYYGGYNTPIYTRTRYYSNGTWHWSSWTKYADVITSVAQIQATLTNSVTISAGDVGKIFDNVNLKTGNVFSSFSIGTQADIPDKVTGIVLLWASGGNCLPNDQIAWASGAVTLGVKNVGGTSATLTAVRLLLFGTYN